MREPCARNKPERDHAPRFGPPVRETTREGEGIIYVIISQLRISDITTRRNYCASAPPPAKEEAAPCPLLFAANPHN